MVQVLQDLENVCGRVACAPLEGAVADLRPLMASTNQIVRNMTYMIILRYLKDNPNAAADLLPDYLDCLDSRIAAVVTTALERLPDFLLLCQGKSMLLLLCQSYNHYNILIFWICLLEQRMATCCSTKHLIWPLKMDIIPSPI